MLRIAPRARDQKKFMIFGKNLGISAIVPCPVWRMPSSPLILAFCLSVAFASSRSLRAWMRKLPAAIKESSEDPRISKQKKFIFFEIIPDIYNAEKQQQLCLRAWMRKLPAAIKESSGFSNLVVFLSLSKYLVYTFIHS